MDAPKARAPVSISCRSGAEREHVGAGVGLPALDLFGRHVRHRADDQALRGQRGIQPRGFAVPRRRNGLGQAEIEQAGAALREHDVARFQVPVHDAVAMRMVERSGNLGAVS